MDLNQLKTFVAVAEEQHLTRAAERLFTSQPAVSAQIKALEETLGLTLFDRTPKGMRLTPAGERLLTQASATLDAARQMLNEAQALKGEVFGDLNIGIHTDFEFLRLAELIRYSGELHPGIKLTFISSMSTDIILDLRKGKHDAGFFFGPCKSADLHITKLASVEMAIAGPVAWKSRIENTQLAQLAELPWVYTSERCPFYSHTSSLFSETGVDINKLVFVDSEDAIRNLVKTEVGIAVLRKQDAIQAEQEGWGFVWEGSIPPISLSMAVPARRMREPLIRVWTELVAECWPTPATNLSQQDIG